MDLARSLLHAGKVTEAAADLDRALLGLADLVAAAPDRPASR